MADESLAGVYEVLKRHEETLRDLVIEVRLLYHNLSDKEKQRLEWSRGRTTQEVGDIFAAKIRSLDETITRLRASQTQTTPN
jgi:DNA-binding CsgD family transcriptional regulator